MDADRVLLLVYLPDSQDVPKEGFCFLLVLVFVSSTESLIISDQKETAVLVFFSSVMSRSRFSLLSTECIKYVLCFPYHCCIELPED